MLNLYPGLLYFTFSPYDIYNSHNSQKELQRMVVGNLPLKNSHYDLLNCCYLSLTERLEKWKF